MFRVITKPKPEQDRWPIEGRLEDSGACAGLPAKASGPVRQEPPRQKNAPASPRGSGEALATGIDAVAREPRGSMSRDKPPPTGLAA
jgi:hypothetical protein